MTPPPPPVPEKIADPFLRTLLLRLLMLLLLAGSACLVWWSVERLTLTNQQLRQKSSAVSYLADAVQQLERRSDPAEAARIDARFQKATNLLFAGLQECVGWEESVREQAIALRLDATVQQGPARPYTNAALKLSLVPETIQIEPGLDTVSTNTPYQRVLSFTGTLWKPGRRLDLVELVVIGGPNSVRQAKAVVQLWSQEGKP
jgi:hypothetical protein